MSSLSFVTVSIVLISFTKNNIVDGVIKKHIPLFQKRLLTQPHEGHSKIVIFINEHIFINVFGLFCFLDSENMLHVLIKRQSLKLAQIQTHKRSITGRINLLFKLYF